MRVLILCYEFPPVGGGGGRVAEDVGRVLVERGHEVAVHTARTAGLSAVERRHGMLIRRSFAFRRHLDRCAVWEMALYVLLGIVPALLFARRFRPDVMHVHFAVPTGVIGWVINRVLGIPYLLTSHMGDVPGGVPSQTDHLFRWLKPITRPIWRDAAALTAVSKHVCDLISTAYARAADVVPNGVDIHTNPASPERSRRPRRIVFAGRFNPQKNVEFAIRLLASCRGRDWEAHFLGDGEDTAKARALIVREALEDRIVLHGWVTPEQVDTELAGSDIVLMPSLAEGFPVVAVKGLALGAVVLGSDIPGMRAVVESGVNGVLCDLEDFDAFSAALARLLDDDVLLSALRMNAVARARQFTLPAVVDRYEAILEGLVPSAAWIVCPRVIRGNRGDIVSRWGIVSALEAMGLGGVTVFRRDPGDLPATVSQQVDYGLVHNLIPSPNGLRALMRGRKVLWTGGLDLQDDSSIAKLLHTLVTFLSYRLLGLRILCVMQGAGPLDTRIGRMLARAVLSLVDIFVARDRQTLGLIKAVAPKTDCVLGHDGIFLDGVAPDGELLRRQAPALADWADHPGSIIGINIRLWWHFSSGLMPYQFAKERYRQRAASRMDEAIAALVKLARALRDDGFRVALVSMYQPGVEPWEDDVPFLERIAANFADDPGIRVIRDDLSTPALLALFDRLSLMVGMRLHSCLTAIRVGRPALHLAYTLKGRDIFDHLGLPQWVMDIDRIIANPEALIVRCRELAGDPAAPALARAAASRATAENHAVMSELVARLTEP